MAVDPLERVADLCAELAVDEERLEAVRERLRKAIRTAYKHGYSMQQIADAAGISRQRVSQIIGKQDH